jgi:hypothetical protein
VSLRTYIRLKKRTFGLDDAFMAIGTVRFCEVYEVRHVDAIH